ncbi:MAG: malto-oligosyltrehalose synthase [Acidobacteriia bacterium]|nr:malto-oligosyltrehalose synthase [Terriglobia bacterium]
MSFTTPSRIPGATYRLQFHKDFRFADGRDLIPYLNDLGITDLYSSPRYKARRGSSHGYDIANPLRVNSELGTEEDFDEMAEKLRHYSMGLLLDTVPNHMAASYENPWWMDVLENGSSSAYAGFFDIDWHPATSKAAFLQENRVLLPILGDLYGNVLASGELALKIEDTGIHVRYYETRLPLDPKTYLPILKSVPQTVPELAAVIEGIEALGDRNDPDLEVIAARREAQGILKSNLWNAYQANAELKRSVDDALLYFTTHIDELDHLLSMQAYRLAYWKIGYEEINYRRFFDINELVGLRIEAREVFDQRNQKTLELVRSGQVTGLRIDHIDGLWDPDCFLRRLQSASGDVYTVVEKILGRDEPLPPEWPVAGTTGYDFLNVVNGIFVHADGERRLEEVYSRHTGNYLPFAELCYASNKQVMQTLFRGDVNALGHHLGRLAAHHRHARDIPLSELMDVLVELSACLPVYRTYIHDFEITPRDRGYIERTLDLARRRTSREQISNGAFHFMREMLLLEPPYYLEGQKQDWLQFVMRWQQFTGPVMAKGLEDTAMYRHNSLLSLNEVGGDPLRERPPFTLEEFHEFNRKRLAQWPHTMNATSTHDTKRGEDSRARLNVLTEMPGEWEAHLNRWVEWNADKKSTVKGTQAPSSSEEILIYQTLLGAWPTNPDEEAEFSTRVNEFLRKALREAKQNSSWIAPHESYERAVQEFVDRILSGDSPFLSDFREFQKKLVLPGVRNSLGQLLLKITAPGVPDFYQGSELWQLSLVDPDNRRPIDYRRRGSLLEALRRREAEDSIALVRDLAANPSQDEMKLFVTYKALLFRRSHPDLFTRGEYVPLKVNGACAEHICGFARRWEGQWAVVIAPRWTVGLSDWADTEIILPDSAPGDCRDALTGLIPASFRTADLLREFPVALVACQP